MARDSRRMISRVWLSLIEVCSESNTGHNSLFQRAAVPEEISLGTAEFEVVDGEKDAFDRDRVHVLFEGSFETDVQPFR